MRMRSRGRRRGRVRSRRGRKSYGRKRTRPVRVGYRF